jgi:uncharacterized protein
MKQIFINLSVENVDKALIFYLELGFTINPRFTFEDQKCIMWSEHIYVMLISKTKFLSYSQEPQSEESKVQSAYFTLPVESLERVHQIVNNGLKAGGKEPQPMIDEGFMQIRRLRDLDGHTWDIIYLNMDEFNTRLQTNV